jgi:hypothetical protein
MSKSYTYVDRFGVGIAVTEINDGALLLHIYPANNGKPIGVVIPLTEQPQLATEITNHYHRAIQRAIAREVSQMYDGAGAAGHVADDAADEEPLGSGDETAPSYPKE